MRQLIKQARQAIRNKDYSEACVLYRELLGHEEVKDNIDFKFRLAWCSEKAGYLNDACALYEGIIAHYHQQGETGSAASLQAILDRLRKPKEITSAVDFEALAKADRKRLIRQLLLMGEERVLATGKTLFNVGDVAKHLWLLLEGSVRISWPEHEHHDRVVTVAADEEAELFAEDSVFTLQRREYTVTGEKISRLMAVSIEKITQLRQQSIDFDIAMEHLMRERWVTPILSRHPIFQRVNDIDRVRISHLFEPVELQVGECLMRRNEDHQAAYLVQEGCLFLVHERIEHDEEEDETGEEPDDGALLASVLPGCFLHLGGLLRGYESSCRVVAITPVRLLRLTQQTFESISNRRPWMIQALLRLVRLPISEQVMQPHEDDLWNTNNKIELRKVSQDDEYA